MPVFDEHGRLRSVRACRTDPGIVPVSLDVPKRLPPKGYRAEGLIMANSLGRIVLAGGVVPSWWPESKPLRIVVCEGEPDFLTWASEYSDGDETAPAVFGVVSGSWTGISRVVSRMGLASSFRATTIRRGTAMRVKSTRRLDIDVRC